MGKFCLIFNNDKLIGKQQTLGTAIFGVIKYPPGSYYYAPHAIVQPGSRSGWYSEDLTPLPIDSVPEKLRALVLILI